MPRPENPRLIDTFGRVATDLRVSLTDRCNLRCTYCMPAEGLDWMPGEEVLTDDELVRLMRIAVEMLGVTDIRLTGGEPLLRPGLEDLVARITALEPRPRLSMTTNGIGLAKRAKDLAAAGLARINVSLDTVDPATFLEITRRDRLSHVLAGMAAARDAGMTPVKVNAVLMRGVNDTEAVALLKFCLAEGYHLRFIEQMPLDAQHGWNRGEMITASEILGMLGTEFSLSPFPVSRGGAAGRALAGRRRPRRRRRDRVGDPAVLRRLRADPADRGRRGALLPVQQRRDRPARPRARGCAR